MGWDRNISILICVYIKIGIYIFIDPPFPFSKSFSYIQHAQESEEYKVLTAQEQKKLREAAAQKDRKGKGGKKRKNRTGRAKKTPKGTKKDKGSTKGPNEDKAEKKGSMQLIPKDQQYKFKELPGLPESPRLSCIFFFNYITTLPF